MKLSLRPQRDFPEIMLPLREIAAIGTRHIQADELYTKSISGQVYADIPYDAALILEEDILPSRSKRVRQWRPCGIAWCA